MYEVDWWTADSERRQEISREVLDRLRSRVGTAGPRLEECCEIILEAASRLGFVGVALWLPTREGSLRNGGFTSSVEMTVFEGQSRELRFAPGEGMPGRTLLHDAPEWISNVIRDDNFPRLRGAIRDLVRTVAAFPVREGIHTIAVVELFSREMREPDSETLEFLATLGVTLGGYMAALTLTEP